MLNRDEPVHRIIEDFVFVVICHGITAYGA